MTGRLKLAVFGLAAVAGITCASFALGNHFGSASIPLPGGMSPAGHEVPVALALAAKAESQTKAPDFTLTTTDGKSWNLTDHAAHKPVLLFFVEKDCPCCVGAKPFMERVRHAYEGQVDMLGIVDADQAASAKWAQNVAAMFPVAYDPNQSVIQAYGAKRGAYAVLIGTGPVIKVVYPGYSKSMMEELGSQIASLAGVKPAVIDTSDAPERLASGCDFPSPPPKP